eukprot:365441-Chlamydomonas_euryale.AAC.16
MSMLKSNASKEQGARGGSHEHEQRPAHPHQRQPQKASHADWTCGRVCSARQDRRSAPCGSNVQEAAPAVRTFERHMTHPVHLALEHESVGLEQHADVVGAALFAAHRLQRRLRLGVPLQPALAHHRVQHQHLAG